MEYENKICFRLFGRDALFTDPVTKTGGEKCTYSIPTYQALKGITESIYWKPTFIWYIDRLRVMKPIRTQAKGMRIMKYQEDKNDLSIYTYLRDVEYHVEAHFEWNEQRPELAADRNENKHYLIAKRMLERGGRRDIFLGCRECQGYVEPCSFDEGESPYDQMEELPLGWMVHGISYPDETGREYMETRLWKPVMRHGCVEFIRPEACSVVQQTRKMSPKKFDSGNFSGLQEFEGGGEGI